MSNSNPTKTLLEPTLLDAFLSFKADIFYSLNCVKIGQIVSYNGTKHTAEVQVLFTRVLANGQSVTVKPLLDVPVMTLQGGGASIQLPISAGDQCILLFSDRNIDAWFQNGAQAVPFDGRKHDLSDGIAIVGINAQTGALTATPSNEVVISYAGATVGLKGGKIRIKNATKDLRVILTSLVSTLVGMTTASIASGATQTALTPLVADIAALLY